jgi:hypothetical protein
MAKILEQVRKCCLYVDEVSYECDKNQPCFDVEGSGDVELHYNVCHEGKEACRNAQPSDDLNYWCSVEVGDNDLFHLFS